MKLTWQISAPGLLQTSRFLHCEVRTWKSDEGGKLGSAPSAEDNCKRATVSTFGHQRGIVLSNILCKITGCQGLIWMEPTNHHPKLACTRSLWPYCRFDCFLTRFTQVSKRNLQQVIVSERASAMDWLSKLGGTLGLCAGISIISAAEAIFWDDTFKLI